MCCAQSHDLAWRQLCTSSYSATLRLAQILRNPDNTLHGWYSAKSNSTRSVFPQQYDSIAMYIRGTATKGALQWRRLLSNAVLHLRPEVAMQEHPCQIIWDLERRMALLMHTSKVHRLCLTLLNMSKQTVGYDGSSSPLLSVFCGKRSAVLTRNYLGCSFQRAAAMIQNLVFHLIALQLCAYTVLAGNASARRSSGTNRHSTAHRTRTRLQETMPQSSRHLPRSSHPTHCGDAARGAVAYCWTQLCHVCPAGETIFPLLLFCGNNASSPCGTASLVSARRGSSFFGPSFLLLPCSVSKHAVGTGY